MIVRIYVPSSIYRIFDEQSRFIEFIKQVSEKSKTQRLSCILSCFRNKFN